MNGHDWYAFKVMFYVTTGCVGAVVLFARLRAYPASVAAVPFWLLSLPFLIVAVPLCSLMVMGIVALPAHECARSSGPRYR